jgi:predicted nucleic acid-binding protein
LMVLFDSMIWVYANTAPIAGDEEARFLHETATRLVERANNGELEVCIATKILWEVYSVLTRRVEPRWDPSGAAQLVRDIAESDCLTVLYAEPSATAIALDLIAKHEPKGAVVFDICLAATMLSCGVETIYTGNTDHFAGISGLTVINPFVHP